jgi:hypothetical protein
MMASAPFGCYVGRVVLKNYRCHEQNAEETPRFLCRQWSYHGTERVSVQTIREKEVMADDGLAFEILDRLWHESQGTSPYVEPPSVEFSTWAGLSATLKLDLSARQLRVVVEQLERAKLVYYVSFNNRLRAQEEHPSGHKITILEEPTKKILRRLEAGPISVLADSTKFARLGALFGLPATEIDVWLGQLVKTGEVELTVLPGRKTYEKYTHAFS